MMSPFIGSWIDAGLSTADAALLLALYPLAKTSGYALSCLRTIARWPLQGALSVAALAHLVMSLSFAWPVLVLCRIAEGLAFGWLMAICSASLIAQADRAGEHLGWLNAASSCGVLIGPLLSAFALHWQVPHTAFGIVAILVAGTLIFMRALTRHSPFLKRYNHEPRQAFDRMRGALSSPFAWIIISTFALFDLTYGFLAYQIPILFASPFKEKAAFAVAALFSGGFLIFIFALAAFSRFADRASAGFWLALSLIGVAACFALIPFVATSRFVLLFLFAAEYLAVACAYALALGLLAQLGPRSPAVAGFIQSLSMAAGPFLAEYAVRLLEVKAPWVLASLYLLLVLALLPALLARQGLRATPQ